MRIFIHRVSQASVTINHFENRSIGDGLLVLLGIEDSDTYKDIEWLCKKISSLRIFPDISGVMNKNVIEMNGEVLVVSQFTLYASTKKGNRPSYHRAAKPEISIALYNKFVDQLIKELAKKVVTGEFGAFMEVEMINYGPVTIYIDSKNKE